MTKKSKRKSESLSILIVEDDQLTQMGLKMICEDYFNHIDIADNKENAIKNLYEKKYDICFIDLHLNGEEVGSDIVNIASQTNAYTVVLTGSKDELLIEKCYQNGCNDFLSKPFDKLSLKKLYNKFINKRKESKLNSIFENDYITLDKVIINQVKNILLNNTDQPIFISGPTGVGKTQLAKIIHNNSINKDQNFVHLNCAEFQESLLESELFGHIKGSFTGAINDKKGMLELANNGTLFLDEITAMPINIQRKLLKAIEEKSFYPVGSEKPLKSNFNLISASCDNIYKLINQRKFREDLFFRIDGHRISIKSLNERLEDIVLLSKTFLNSFQRKVFLKKCAFETLTKYQWPGNIRELKKVISQLTYEDSGIIEAKHVLKYINLENESIILQDQVFLQNA